MNEAKTQLCVLGFLLMNIFLGVIGTFWFRTQQRRREVALRMAMGSSRQGVFLRLMSEGILLLTLQPFLPSLLPSMWEWRSWWMLRNFLSAEGVFWQLLWQPGRLWLS